MLANYFDLVVRETALADTAKVVDMYNQASLFLQKNEVDQWQHGYPNMQVLLQDMDSHNSFVVLKDGKLVGTFALATYDPAYDLIKAGAWSKQEKYFAVHRFTIADCHKGQGISNAVFECIKRLAAQREIQYIRVDTHQDNKIMQHQLRKWGFTYCGIVLQSGCERLAFDLVIERAV